MKHLLKRLGYILLRIAIDLVSLFSRALNAFLFNGSTAETLSARSYIEGMTNPKWARSRRIINAIFFFQEDHCEWAWQLEVERARYTISRLTKI